MVKKEDKEVQELIEKIDKLFTGHKAISCLLALDESIISLIFCNKLTEDNNKEKMFEVNIEILRDSFNKTNKCFENITILQ